MSDLSLYNEAFYAENHKNPFGYERLGDAIHCVIPEGSVLDVGCGCGLVVQRLVNLGHNAWGVDGSPDAKAMAPEGVRDRITTEDIGKLTNEHPQHDKTFASAVCIEVAEHVGPDVSDHLVAFMAGVATEAIVWSAAVPGQGGVGHVNEQMPLFWLYRFEKLGWVKDDIKTHGLRALLRAWHAQHEYAADNFYVLVPSR